MWEGQGRVLEVGEVFYKTLNYNWANLKKFPIKWTMDYGRIT